MFFQAGAKILANINFISFVLRCFRQPEKYLVAENKTVTICYGFIFFQTIWTILLLMIICLFFNQCTISI